MLHRTTGARSGNSATSDRFPPTSGADLTAIDAIRVEALQVVLTESRHRLFAERKTGSGDDFRGAVRNDRHKIFLLCE